MRTSVHRLMKRSGLMDVVRDPNNLQLAATALPILTLAGAGIVKGVGALRDSQEKARAYREMLQLHPHLREERPEEVKRLYSTLQRFGPGFAKDPLVAGAWIRSAVQQERNVAFNPEYRGAGVLGAVQQLVGHEANLARATKDRLRPSSLSTSLALGRELSGATSQVAQILTKAREAEGMIERDAELEGLRRERDIYAKEVRQAYGLEPTRNAPRTGGIRVPPGPKLIEEAEREAGVLRKAPTSSIFRAKR